MAIPKFIFALNAAALAAFVPLIALSAPDKPKVEAPRLIGFGCEAVPGGPRTKTLLAVEEDQFPGQCREIVSIEEGCADIITDADVETFATECRDYWGDGY